MNLANLICLNDWKCESIIHIKSFLVWPCRLRTFILLIFAFGDDFAQRLIIVTYDFNVIFKKKNLVILLCLFTCTSSDDVNSAINFFYFCTSVRLGFRFLFYFIPLEHTWLFWLNYCCLFLINLCCVLRLLQLVILFPINCITLFVRMKFSLLSIFAYLTVVTKRNPVELCRPL